MVEIVRSRAKWWKPSDHVVRLNSQLRQTLSNCGKLCQTLSNCVKPCQTMSRHSLTEFVRVWRRVWQSLTDCLDTVWQSLMCVGVRRVRCVCGCALCVCVSVVRINNRFWCAICRLSNVNFGGMDGEFGWVVGVRFDRSGAKNIFKT